MRRWFVSNSSWRKIVERKIVFPISTISKLCHMWILFAWLAFLESKKIIFVELVTASLKSRDMFFSQSRENHFFRLSQTFERTSRKCYFSIRKKNLRANYDPAAIPRYFLYSIFDLRKIIFTSSLQPCGDPEIFSLLSFERNNIFDLAAHSKKHRDIKVAHLNPFKLLNVKLFKFTRRNAWTV